MPQIGPLELLVVGIVALIVLGPSRLPEIARNVGKAMREFKAATEGIKAQFEAGLDQAGHDEPVAGRDEDWGDNEGDSDEAAPDPAATDRSADRSAPEPRVADPDAAAPDEATPQPAAYTTIVNWDADAAPRPPQQVPHDGEPIAEPAARERLA